MTDIAGLIERLERAEGQSRDLDALIWRRLENRSGVVFPDEKPGSPKYPSHIPAYTASLDAALELVERVRPGAWVEISGPRSAWRAETDDRVGWGATPAIALLIALLKSLETEQ